MLRDDRVGLLCVYGYEDQIHVRTRIRHEYGDTIKLEKYNGHGIQYMYTY